jgi:hypothetical protein|tara:strand:+ start:326 stop:598 length:273 start_codon:yes stop_codon:yes gene_type:complete
MDDEEKSSHSNVLQKVTDSVGKRAKPWKKIIALLILPFIYIAIDGTLTYDIFDFKLDTPFEWITFLIVLVLFLAIYITDKEQAKTSKRKD